MTVEKLQAAEGHDELLQYAMMLNNEVRYSAQGELLGDSTETALVSHAKGLGHTRKDAEHVFPLEAKLPFEKHQKGSPPPP